MSVSCRRRKTSEKKMWLCYFVSIGIGYDYPRFVWKHPINPVFAVWKTKINKNYLLNAMCLKLSELACALYLWLLMSPCFDNTIQMVNAILPLFVVALLIFISFLTLTTSSEFNTFTWTFHISYLIYIVIVCYNNPRDNLYKNDYRAFYHKLRGRLAIRLNLKWRVLFTVYKDDDTRLNQYRDCRWQLCLLICFLHKYVSHEPELK